MNKITPEELTETWGFVSTGDDNKYLLNLLSSVVGQHPESVISTFENEVVTDNDTGKKANQLVRSPLSLVGARALIRLGTETDPTFVQVVTPK